MIDPLIKARQANDERYILQNMIFQKLEKIVNYNNYNVLFRPDHMIVSFGKTGFAYVHYNQLMIFAKHLCTPNFSHRSLGDCMHYFCLWCPRRVHCDFAQTQIDKALPKAQAPKATKKN